MPPGTGILYLIPVALNEGVTLEAVPPATLAVARRLDTFIVENAKFARHFLKVAGYPRPLQQAHFHVLDEHTREAGLDALLALLLAGEDCGLMSEAGCPAVADPGAALVRRAHEASIRVVPLAGSSSILLALMASGMNGQRFAFHGYLPVDKAERTLKINALEAEARAATQIFIETPYRNAALLQALVENCRPDTLLCVAADLTGPSEFVVTRTVAAWKKKPPVLDRLPAVFLLYRGKP